MFASGTQVPLCIIYIQYSLEFYPKRAKTLKNTKRHLYSSHPPFPFCFSLEAWCCPQAVLACSSVPGCVWCCCHLGLNPILVRMSHLRVLHGISAVPPVCALEILSLDTQQRMALHTSGAFS